MKAQELRVLADAARAKYAKERPAELKEDLLKRMESLSNSGICCMDFCFSDKPEVIHKVITLLREEGFKVSSAPGCGSATRFEW
jgi:hypothetical protein